MPIKVDEDIFLSELSVHNAKELFDLVNGNRNHLRKWLSWVDKTRDINNTIDYIQSTQQQDIYSGRLVLEVWYKCDLAGLIDLHGGDSLNMKAEIGYWIAEKFQGKGIMTKACRAFIDYAFNEIGLNRIVIRCAVDNVKSRAVPERLDFKFEGIEREGQQLYGKFLDLRVYSLVKSEWFNKVPESTS
jgi:ribosomal-protein-serine acetyltransferase